MKKRILRTALVFLILFLIAAAAFAFWRHRQMAPRDIPVLMYHNILPPSPDLTVWQVSSDEFAWQMGQLAEAGYTPVLPSAIARAARGLGSLPKKPIVITFDDGYYGVARNAEPILAQHRFKAICYAIVGRIGGSGYDRGVFDSGPLLSTNELVALAARGHIAVGSHSMTHSRSPQCLAAEIVPSRRALRDLGIRTRDYCYPYGLHGYDYMYDALRQGHYTTAFICEDEMFHYGTDTNLFAIPRISVYGGLHRISLLSVDPDSSQVVFANYGASIPLRAVVRDLATGRSWSSDLARVGGPDPVAFSFPPEALDGPRSIEAWDKFGIFRYYPVPQS